MLQIATGRFARKVELYETKHRFTLFTNAVILNAPNIETAFGTIFPSTVSRSWTIEVIERQEATTPTGEKEFFLSTLGTEIAQDFAILLSFALAATFTTDEKKLSELIASAPPVLGGTPNSKYLAKVFDECLYVSAEEIDWLRVLFERLLKLPRNAFVATLSAIRRYVQSTHIVSVEPSLAYTLQVMAIEAIAQNDTEGHVQWSDIDYAKARAIDKALCALTEDEANEVRTVICKHEN